MPEGCGSTYGGGVARVALTDDELADAARIQVRLLLKACNGFDAGDVDEAINIAARLRVLLHHNPKSGSYAALEPFDVLTQPWFVASGGDSVDENYLPEHKLLHGGSLSTSHSFWEPRFADFGSAPPLPWQLQAARLSRKILKPRGGGRGRTFDDWWGQVVIRDAERVEFTRADVVFAVANTDGGHHVDRSIKDTHHRLTRKNAMGMFSGGVPKDSPVPPTLRQIGWEVHSMLDEHLPQLLPEAWAPPRT